MLYSEFLEGTKSYANAHNAKVYDHLNALYSMTDISKEEIYRIGKKFVSNPEPINEKLGLDEYKGKYITVYGYDYGYNLCKFWCEQLSWDIKVSNGHSVYKLRRLSDGEIKRLDLNHRFYTDDLKLDYDDENRKSIETKGHDWRGNKIDIKWVK